ncbi:MAG: monofunctional biosynthetic peptidoglycan transglycosylase [Bacteroidota bacterium]
MDAGGSRLTVWKTLVRWVMTHKLLVIFLVLVAVALAELVSIPWFSVARLRDADPLETALMRQRREEAEEEGRLFRIHHRWIPLSQLPRHFLQAVIVAEDGTFFTHGGIEWYEVRESITRNLREGRIARGGSTITQQLAKNLYLSTSKDPLRKVKEVIIALLMERHLTKNRILELYVNVIEWGDGVYGVEAASREYFGKTASRLTLDEAVALAAVIPAPRRHRPDTPTRYLRYHTGVILERMRERNMQPDSSARNGMK